MASIDSGDTGWMLISTALVMLMTPGLAFFYGGLVRRKNVLSIMMQCLMLVAVISLQWVLFGYSLAFGPDHGGVIGGLSWAGLHGVGLDAEPRLRGHHPPAALHGLPDDVRRHHARPHHRSLCRAHEVQRVSGLLASCGPRSSTTLWRTGSGARAGSSRSSALSTSPAGPWCTSAPGWAPWPPRWWWDGGGDIRTSRRRTTCPSPSWARLCCGSAGSASTRAARSTSGALAVSAFISTQLAAAAAAIAWAVLDWVSQQAADRSGPHLGRHRRPGHRHPGRRLRHARWAPSASAPWPGSSATSRWCSSRTGWATTTRSTLSACTAWGGCWGCC